MTARPSTVDSVPNTATPSRILLPRSFPAAMRIALGSVLIGLILSAGGVFGGRTPKVKPAAPDPMAVNTMVVKVQNGYEVMRDFVGVVEANRASDLSLELGGMVKEILVDEGDEVGKGQILARLDTELLQSEMEATQASLVTAQSRLGEMVAGPRTEVIQAAKADVAQWTAKLNLAMSNRQRQERLKQRNAGSRQELDDAVFGQQAVASQLAAARAKLQELHVGTRKEQIAAQRADVDRLSARVESIRIRIRKSDLVAPFSGKIANRFVDEGTVIDSGIPALRLLETERLIARIGVTTKARSDLSPGQSRSVSIDGREFAATIRSIRPDLNQRTRTLSVLLELDSTFPSVGDLARMDVRQTIHDEGFWLPMTALSESHRGLWAVYAVVKNGAFCEIEQRELEVLHQTSDAVYVRGSLRSGEVIVRDGIQRLVPNQIVRALERTPMDRESLAQRSSDNHPG